jgi:hypothetical protein
MGNRWTRAREDLIQFRRRQSVVAGLTFLVLTAVNIPVTIATARIWRVLFVGWKDTSWNALREFFIDALAATFIDVGIWLIVGLIAWAWLADRRGAN